MDPVKRVRGRALPLDRADVDTDQVIPSSYLKRIGRTGFADGLFAAWRRDASFVANDPRYAGASVLVAGANFGCGSSREHAAWALRDGGFTVIVAPSFADIFRSNALRTGLVPVRLDAALVTRIMRAVEQDPAVEIDVDVEAGRVRVPSLGIDERLDLDDFTRSCLVQGLDEIGLTLRHEADIAAYEARRPAWRPRIAPAGTGRG
ncbi:MAG: 3-isopropylmalate dehydratase small subunit [Chloroflexota bacterium]|nr:3-isopropylmalate dehydratase small subunit [Chloroflexota bacterium]